MKTFCNNPLLKCFLLMLSSINAPTQQVQLQRHPQLFYHGSTSTSSLHARASNYDPILKAKSLNGYLPESAVAGTRVRISPSPNAPFLQILVEDKDLHPGMPSAIYQYILTGYGADRFAVDQWGNLYLNSNDIDIDRSSPTYTLRVIARETDTEPIRTSAPITIRINVFEENSIPDSQEIPQSIYIANVSALDSRERVIAQIKINSQEIENISYRILDVSDAAQKSFRYDHLTNELVAVGSLVPGHIYKVTIEASDGNEPIAQAIVIVQALHIQAHLTPSSTLHVTPTSQYSGRQQITKNMSTQTVNEQSNSQTVNFSPKMGVQSLSKTPHVALIPAHIMTTPMPTSLLPLQVPFSTLMPMISSLEKSNTGEAMHQMIKAELNEATPPNSIITVLGDANTRDRIYFKISSGNEMGTFAINSDTGAVTTTSKVDREKQGAYSLQIDARSRSSDQFLYTTTLTILVIDSNDNSPQFTDKRPIFIRLKLDNSTSAIQLLKPNLFLGKINVHDVDEGENGRVSLKILPPMDRLFTIKNNGEINVNGILTISHLGTHRLAIIASDAGQPPLETRTVVTVEIKSHFDTTLKKSALIGGGQQSLASALPSLTSGGSTSAEETKIDEYVENNAVIDQNMSEVPFSRATLQTQQPLFTRLSPPDSKKASTKPIPTSIHNQTNSTPANVLKNSNNTETESTHSESELINQLAAILPRLKPNVISQLTTTLFTPTPAALLKSIDELTEPTDLIVSTESTIATKNGVHNQRLAPIFLVDNIDIKVQKGEKQDKELFKVEAKFPDNKSGPITYIIEAGDDSLFRINSSTGVVSLLRTSKKDETSYFEEKKLFRLRIGTFEAKNGHFTTSPLLSHNCNVTLRVNENESNSNIDLYEFEIDTGTEPGTVVGQMTLQNEGQNLSNDKIKYSIFNREDGLNKYFALDSERSELILIRKIPVSLAGTRLTLEIGTKNNGGIVSSKIQIKIKEENKVKELEQPPQQLSSYPSEQKSEKQSKLGVQFSKKIYSATVSEVERPPVVAMTLQILNKPTDIRFIICTIREGNYQEAFSVLPNAKGDCELRTQVQLDRETMAHYKLNVSVESEKQVDFAIAVVSVLDANDNAPKFIFPSYSDQFPDLIKNEYIVAISASAHSMTPFFTVKANDSDEGNNSLVEYSLEDHTSSRSTTGSRSVQDLQYFMIDKATGQILIKKSAKDIVDQSQKDHFIIMVVACDTPKNIENKLCSRAKLTINICSDQHRFATILHRVSAEEIRHHEEEMKKSLRLFTEPCSFIEAETLENAKQANSTTNVDVDAGAGAEEYTTIIWHAIDPSNKKICPWKAFRKLFDSSTKSWLSKEWLNWTKIHQITPVREISILVGNENKNDFGSKTIDKLLSADWTAIPTIVWIGAGAFLFLMVGICGICALRAWHDRNYRRRCSPRRLLMQNGAGQNKKLYGKGIVYPMPSTIYPPPSNRNIKYGSENRNELFTSRSIVGSGIKTQSSNNIEGRNKFYETQMLELPIVDNESGTSRLPNSSRPIAETSNRLESLRNAPNPQHASQSEPVDTIDNIRNKALLHLCTSPNQSEPENCERRKKRPQPSSDFDIRPLHNCQHRQLIDHQRTHVRNNGRDRSDFTNERGDTMYSINTSVLQQ